MEEFLRTVAKHYIKKVQSEAEHSNEPASLPLSRYLFCFPNRRSGLFFARYLKEEFGGPCIAPSMTTINELFGYFSSRQVVDRISLLFRLYSCYDKLCRQHDHETFDQFVFWGDMILSDFDDIDKYLADADKVFANVRELKEIDALFDGFDQEQIEIIKRFWTSFDYRRTDSDDKREVFAQTWAILSQLYHSFKDVLSNENLAYAGMMEREVVEKLRSEDFQSSLGKLPFDKVVFVGLTAISKADRSLMSMLKVSDEAEFCWDYADPQLQVETSQATSAAFFTKSNLSDFPNELSAEELSKGIVSQKDKRVELYAVASGVGQTIKAQQILKRWKIGQDEEPDPIRTAVVLPDEKLLLPMLYALPHSVGDYNVTMGYGLKNSPVFSFVSSLFALQKSYSNGTFYAPKVFPVLDHSFTRCATESKSKVYKDQIIKDNQVQVKVSHFEVDPFMSLIFRPLTDACDAVDYLKHIFNHLLDKAADDIHLKKDAEKVDSTGQGEIEFPTERTNPEGTIIYCFNETDYEFLYHYNKILIQLEAEMKSSSIRFTPQTLFMLLEKLVMGSSVPFSGEPLKGLQLMGVLETRSLDFDNVLILSMNEGTFPAKAVPNTFIPMSLRDAFGLPTQRHRDSVFAYHFYRLISRAKRLTMIYDNRADGMQTGEESRYIKQMRYLLGYQNLSPIVQVDNIKTVETSDFVVQKDEAIIAELSKYYIQNGDRQNLSVTALKRYIECPMRFYYQYVLHLFEDNDITEDVDNPIFGNILHKAICRIYSQFVGKTIDEGLLAALIDDKHRQCNVSKIVESEFKQVMKVDEISGYNLLIQNIIVRYIKDILKHDKSLCPFVYVDGEKPFYFDYLLNSNTTINVYCGIDRIDRSVNDPNVMRIVDYKTGNSSGGAKLYFPSVEDLFLPQSKGSEEAFQVMFYSYMLAQHPSKTASTLNTGNQPVHIAPHLYFTRDIHDPNAETSVFLGTKKTAQRIDDISPYCSEFGERLRALMAEIFDPSVPFKQCDDKKQCKHCYFLNLCNRI